MRLRAALILTILAALPATAWARSTSCRTSTYCDGSTCQAWDSVLKVATRSDGTATYAWDDAPAVEATVLQDGPTLMVSSTTADGTGSLLVVGERGQASYATSTDFGDYVISGFYLLTCTGS